MMDEYEKIGRIMMLIIDNGSEFGAHRKDEKGNWNSEFKRVGGKLRDKNSNQSC